jgi:hypothetical protein
MKNNQKGQSTIEFIFSFVFAVSFILMVFNTSLNYVSGYVTHYATYMASRVFLTQSSNFSADWGPGDTFVQAERQARLTFEKYSLDVFGIQNSGFNVTEVARRNSLSAGEYLMVGVFTKFDRKIDLVGQITGQAKLELISESFLGREPTRGVCASRVCRAITYDIGECDSASMDITLFDDGC